MSDDPVIMLEGARAVGKSTLLAEIAAQHDVAVIDLDDDQSRYFAQTEPTLAVQGASPVCIDEYQHVPAILQSIKAELNRDYRPGRFVLTGSTSRDALPRGTQTLTGRLHVLPIRPLSQAELHGTAGLLGSLDHGDRHDLRSSVASVTERSDYVDRVLAGGFPIALARADSTRRRWFLDHVRTTLERDTAELATLRQAAALPTLFESLASQTAQVLTVSRAARSAELDDKTATSYIELLERLFLVERLPAWGRTLRSRVGKKPKIHLVDSGVAAAVLGLSRERLTRFDPAAATEFGHLLETFVFGEVAAQTSWFDVAPTLGHYRTSRGAEVDIVVERHDGGVIGIEVKASGNVRAADFAGLAELRDLLGDRFVVGIVLHLGPYSTRAPEALGEHLFSIPVDRLWTG